MMTSSLNNHQSWKWFINQCLILFEKNSKNESDLPKIGLKYYYYFTNGKKRFKKK